jgi:fatty acid desaturase
LVKEMSAVLDANPVGDASLAPSDAIGAAIVMRCSLATGLGIWWSASASLPLWLLGQTVLALALLQWFVILHEAGHQTLFRKRALNSVAGQLAGLFALIPFASWRRVHGLHHLWTGWQDLDPTTAALAPRERSRLQRTITDLTWRLWLPLFSVVYRLGNYWHLPRLLRMFPASAPRRALIVNALGLVACYGALVWLLDPIGCVRLLALALFLSLAMQDPLILSQHTHIAQQLSHGRKVDPLPAAEQERYTRSLRFPGWVSRWILLGFNAHELHHRFPGVPGYRLGRIAHVAANEVHWWTWLCAVKRLRGSVFVFENSATTGFRW